MAVGFLAPHFVRRIASTLVVTVAFGMCVGASPAVASPAGHTSGRVSFYGDVGNPINSPYSKNPLVVRPSKLFLTEDGSVALLGLHWLGWGSKVARARGVLSASNCTPNCATGPRTTSPARLTLSSPGRVLGHQVVYRCFQVSVPSHPQEDQHDCLRSMGTLTAYSPVNTSAPPTTRTLSPRSGSFYTGRLGWYCSMLRRGVYCEDSGRGHTASLTPNGKVTICTAGIAACKVGNAGIGIPTLHVGKQVTIKPFRCRYSNAGLTCTLLSSGHGFRLRTNGRVARV